jgi:DNA-binding LytR/AlgR family response regulator
LRIAVCDDDNRICNQIEKTLLDHAKKNSLNINVEIFDSSSSILKYLYKGCEFDLIYLDIEIDEMNGIEVGSQIRNVLKSQTTEIVYISGIDGYDRQLFNIHPLHFIPKPINDDLVIDDMLVAMDRSKKYKQSFSYKKDKSVYYVPLGNIIYFEGQNRMIKIVKTDGEDEFYGVLDSVTNELSDYMFIRIHRSYLINYNHISKSIYSEVEMSNGHVITIGRNKRKALRNYQIDME